MPDIDIDMSDRQSVIDLLHPIKATGTDGRKHNTGVYFHTVPFDPETALCTLDFKQAEEAGFFKIDLINVNIYKEVKDRAHLKRLLDTPPNWALLHSKSFCEGLFQLSGHNDACKEMNPTSVEELAAMLALIRPGKRHLLGQPWSVVLGDVWKPEKDGYVFRKSHGFAYALAVIVHMNLKCGVA